MSKKYCKKSSVQAVVNEVKTRKGSSSSIQGSNIANEISGLVLPTQRGEPNTVLTASNPSATIQRGKYTGGTVSVTSQSKTATLSSSGSTVTADSGKTLASVTVPATTVYQVFPGNITPSSDASSISITGFSFTPKGVAICISQRKSKQTISSPTIGGIIAIKDVGVSGLTPAVSSTKKYFGVIDTASVSYSYGNVTLSNIKATQNSSQISCTFLNNQYTFFVWGN